MIEPDNNPVCLKETYKIYISMSIKIQITSMWSIDIKQYKLDALKKNVRVPSLGFLLQYKYKNLYSKLLNVLSCFLYTNFKKKIK